MSYKVIIFDFGGVLYNVDYFASSKALGKLSGRPEIFENMSLVKIMDFACEFEKGLISAGEFRSYIKTEYELNGSNDEINAAWNAMLLGIKPEAFDFVKKIKEIFPIALLSNTNLIHYNFFKKESVELFNLFGKVFLSYKIGMRKPDSEIYHFACKSLDVLPDEVLFIDDSEINISAAKEAGLNVIHFSNGMKLSDLLHTIKHIPH